MRHDGRLDRRGFLQRAMVLGSSLMLAGCDQLSRSDWFRRMLDSGETLTRTSQRAILGPNDMAREYDEADLSPHFRPNGSIDPQDADYLAQKAQGFSDWKLQVGGLVERPMALSLVDLRALPSRTQITRHDCVEGWSCIGKWKGVPLKTVLDKAGLKPEARYIVFYCADTLEQTLAGDFKYYESLGMPDAFHAQTILAYDMNDKPLPVAYGAPLRLRVERQLGYKMAKYVMRIDAVADYADIDGGQGGFWEDRGYEWYAGI